MRAFSFIHASDTHLDEESIPRFRRLREITEERGVDFVLIMGDLIRDALRVSEGTARERFELFRKEKSDFRVPVWVVPGNHENCGIERDRSVVSSDRPTTRSTTEASTSSRSTPSTSKTSGTTRTSTRSR